MQISNTFGIELNKDVVRRVLIRYFNPTSGGEGPSWLTFIGHLTDNLWSVDLFCCESILLKTHWVMVIMDQYTRRIIGFAIHKGHVDGMVACRMFNSIISMHELPKYLSSDNDPIFTFHRWKSNLRVLDIKEIKSLPCQPRSHPFVERLIGSIRRELLNKVLFWTENDLKNKLSCLQTYFNHQRSHWGIGGITPIQKVGKDSSTNAELVSYSWKKFCCGLVELPIAV
jgi:putative transposase